jgi:hypothetical protein
MARGIHLKDLRSADLEAIGVPDDHLTEVPGDESGESLSLMAQADPVLSRTLIEVRQDLEATLQHLNEALSLSSSTKEGPPATPEE